MITYEVVYGQNILSATSYVLRTSKVHAVDRMIHTREAIIHILKDNLFIELNRMKQQDDEHRYERYFN